MGVNDLRKHCIWSVVDCLWSSSFIHDRTWIKNKQIFSEFLLLPFSYPNLRIDADLYSSKRIWDFERLRQSGHHRGASNYEIELRWSTLGVKRHFHRIPYCSCDYYLHSSGNIRQATHRDPRRSRKNVFLTLRHHNVNFFTLACVCAVLTMKEFPQASGNPHTPA